MRLFVPSNRPARRTRSRWYVLVIVDATATKTKVRLPISSLPIGEIAGVLPAFESLKRVAIKDPRRVCLNLRVYIAAEAEGMRAFNQLPYRWLKVLWSLKLVSRGGPIWNPMCRERICR